MIKMVDTAVPMNEEGYPVARAKHIWLDDDTNLQKAIDDGLIGGNGTASNIQTLTQEEYDALDPQEQLEGEFYCYDSGRHFRNGVEYGKDGVQISDNETVENKTWSSKKTSDEISEKVDKTDITTTIDSTSTDTQVPSAKSVNDKYEEANVYKGKYVGDLNDIPFIKSGVVYKYDIRSGNCTNTPVGTHGILYSTYFDSDNYCLQEFHALQTNKASIYRRDKGTGVWSAWTELATMDKVQTKDDTMIKKTYYHPYGSEPLDIETGHTANVLIMGTQNGNQFMLLCTWFSGSTLFLNIAGTCNYTVTNSTADGFTLNVTKGEYYAVVFKY